jgi:hypothetical protein
MGDGPIVPGWQLDPLPGEKMVDHLEGTGLYLTTRRLIFSGREYVLFFLPGPEVLRVALLTDVDYAGSVAERLPWWVLVIGVFLFFGGLAVVGLAPAAVVIVLLGIVIVLLWWFLKRRSIVFSVNGQERFAAHLLRGQTGLHRVDRFLSQFFQLKWEIMSSERPVKSGES